MPTLRTRDLVVRFGREAGLLPLSLDVRAGERLVLVGASGAGKTTLLKAIAGLVPSESGAVEIAGRDVTRTAAEKRNAVYLRQTPLLFPHLSVRENVAFPLRIRRVSGREMDVRVEQALAAVRLEDLGERRPSSLSGGQSQRVALARAIVARPAILLLDEPLSALDPSLREEVRQSIVRVVEEYEPGFVMVTHDLDEAGLLADRIGVLIDRQLAQVAIPAELFARPASLAVARFLGMPNQLPGTVLEDGTFRSAQGEFRMETRGVIGPAVAVFRSDALRPRESGELRGRVLSLLHRSHQTAALVDVGGERLEAAVDPLDQPAVGAGITLTLDPRRVAVFPA